MIKVQAFVHTRPKRSVYVERNDLNILEVKDEIVNIQDFELIYHAVCDWLSKRFEPIEDEWFEVTLTKSKDEDGSIYYIEYSDSKPQYPESLTVNELLIQVETKYIDPLFGDSQTYIKTFKDLLSAQVYYDAQLRESEKQYGVAFAKLVINKR
jgi:hypothetical protein